MRTYLNLFWAFFKIGGLTFGGGYAMLPMLQREVVEKQNWTTEAELMDYYAIGQCMPGLIAANTATFIGNKVKGTPGGIVATLGVVFPSLLVILAVAAFLSNYTHLAAVQNAFAGIQVGVFVLILNAVIRLYKAAVVDLFTTILFATVFFCSLFFSITPVIYVILAGIAGIALQSRKVKQ